MAELVSLRARSSDEDLPVPPSDAMSFARRVWITVAIVAACVLGALGIYVEFSAPGLIAPGVAGAISVLLGLSALSVLPINWAGVALLLLAFALFALEAKFTSHGILGVGGAIAMALGAVLWDELAR